METQIRKQLTQNGEISSAKIEDYAIIRLLGSGAYATVKLG